MKQKPLILILVFLLSTSLAAQTSGSCGDNLIWTQQDSTLTISGSGSMYTYDFSSHKSPWYLSQSIASVIIGDSVTSICVDAFSGCAKLRTVHIGDNITTLPSGCFSSCSLLDSVHIGSRVKNVGQRAFSSASHLRSITGGDSITTIGTRAFWFCDALDSITIPAQVTTIGVGAFSYCRHLRKVILPNGLKRIEDEAFLDCNALLNITTPDSLIYLGVSAFKNCSSITSFSVPNVILSLPNYLFDGCSSLESVSLGNITSIGTGTFGGCKRLVFTIPSSVTTIGSSAFYNCSRLDTVVVPAGVTSVGGSAFRGCTGLKYLSLPNTITVINGSLLYGCKNLPQFTIPSGVTSIGGWAFADCTSLTNLTIPNLVTTIGERAFTGCTLLQSVKIPASVTTIGEYAFDGCSSFSRLVIPATVQHMGEMALCVGLDTIFFDGLTPPIAQGWLTLHFRVTDDSPISRYSICVPCGADSIYKALIYDPDVFANIIKPTPISRYQFSCTTNNEQYGEVTVNTPQLLCDSVTIFAKANYSCTRFVRWSDGNTDFSRTFLLTQDTNLVAVFEAELRTITAVSADESLGIVTGGGSYDCSSEVTLTAVPAEQCHFVRWKDGTRDNPRTVIVAANSKFEAMFAHDDTAIDDVTESSSFRPQKLLENNQLYILLPNGARYTATGQLIK